MLARKSILVVVIQFLIRFLGWLGLVILAKIWGTFAPEALGIIGFAFSFVGIFSIIGDAGFGQAHVKRISEGEDLGTCIGTYATIKLILTVIMLGVVGLAIFVLYMLGMGFKDSTTLSVVLVFMLYFSIMNLQHISTNTFNGRGEIAKMQFTSMFENLVKVPLTILVVLAGVTLVKRSTPVQWPSLLQPLQQFIASHIYGSLAMTYVFGMSTSVFVGFWLLRKYRIKRPSIQMAKFYFAFATPSFFYLIVYTISTYVDKIIIGYFWTSVEVGYYFSVQQILQIILILSFALNTVLFPAYSEYHAKNQLKIISSITNLAERYITMIVVPIVVLVIVFVQPVISILLNSAFLPASTSLIFLALYALFFSLMMPYFSLIGGFNKPGTTAKIGVAMYSMNIILNFLLVPSTGLLTFIGINGPAGAAFSMMISTFCGLIALKLAARKLTECSLFQISTLRHVFAGILMGVLLYGCSLVVPATRWYILAGYGLLGIVIYVCFLVVIKEFTKEDYHFYLNLIHPKEMMRYIRSEFGEDPNNKRP